MENLGTTRNNVEGGSASVERLWNGRYRLEFLCSTDDQKTDWYAENIDGILADFTDEQDHFFGTGIAESWIPDSASVYDNMCCVESKYIYIPSLNGKRVSIAYETLTTAWVQEKDDNIDYELNGLRRVTRQSVALPNTAYGSVVGATSEDSSGTTVWLASSKIDETDAKWTLTETWLEAGLLSTSFSTGADGITSHSQTWLKTVGTTPALPTGAVTGRKIGDYQGLQTITIEKKGFPTNGTFTYETTVPFTIPGVVTTANDDLGVSANNLILVVTPPVPTVADATVVVTYSTTSTVDTSGIWQPIDWTSAQVSGIGFGFRPISSTNTFSNHIRIGTGGIVEADVIGTTLEAVMGTRVYGGTTASISLDGPTFDPAGTTILLSVSNDPIFLDENEVQYYKKTVVNAQIPARP